MQVMFSFVPFFKIITITITIIIIIRWLWDLVVEVAHLGHNVESRALSALRHPGSSRKKYNFELIVYVTTAITFVLEILTSALMEFMSVSTNRRTV